MKVSKFVELKTKRLPHDKRTKKLYGEKDDTDKFFECWNCGFIVNSEKHPAHPSARAKTYLTPFLDWVNLVNEMNEEIVTETGENILVGQTLYYSDISVGCPHCGSPNYK